MEATAANLELRAVPLIASTMHSLTVSHESLDDDGGERGERGKEGEIPTHGAASTSEASCILSDGRVEDVVKYDTGESQARSR